MTTTEAATATQVYQLYIKAPQEQVWDAITNPEIVAKFFHGARVESTYEVGSSCAVCRRTARRSGRTTRFSNRPAEAARAHLAQPLRPRAGGRAGEPGDMGARVPAGGLTRLTLVHDRLEGSPKTAASVKGWSYILSNLKTVIETGEALPPVV